MLRIKETIKRYGLTQSEIARRMGVTPNNINYILYNNNPCFDTLQKIADAIGCDVKELISEWQPDNTITFQCPDCGATFRIERVTEPSKEDTASPEVS